MTLTWPETEDVSSVGVWLWQDREKAQVQHMFHCGWFQVLEHFWPSLTACVIIKQQLQGTVIVELPGPQEAQEKGVVQPRPEIWLFLQSRLTKSMNMICDQTMRSTIS